MGERRRLTKQAQAAQQGGLLKPDTPAKQPGLLRLQSEAGNRAVTDMLGSLSGVPRPDVVRTPLGVTATVYFAKDSELLDPAGFEVVQQLAGELEYLYEPVVWVDGHASGEGAPAHNLSLSKGRRQTVLTFLTGRLRVPVAARGDAYGETQPAVPEEARGEREIEQQRARNRRVEITILYNPRTIAAEERKPVGPGPFPPNPEPPAPADPFRLKIPPPIERPKISLSGEFDKRFNKVADDALDGLGIRKPWVRDLLKRGARAAIDKGAESLLDEALDQGNIRGETREAFKKSLEAGLKFEF